MDHVVQEHLDLFWVAKVLSPRSKQVLAAALAHMCEALAASTAKLAQARSEVKAHFGGVGEVAGGAPRAWQGCSAAEASQSLAALERLIARETCIVQAVQQAMG